MLEDYTRFLQIPLSAKVLIIDDDETLRRRMKDYLEDSGFTVFEAANGKEGLKVFKQENPDVVVTDLQMPIMGGVEVLQTISKESPDTPIIIIAEAKEVQDVIQTLRMGATDYLTKPIVHIPVLEHSISRALERSRLVQENRIYRKELEKTNQALKKNLDILEKDQEAGRSVQMRLLPERNLHFNDYIFTHHIFPSLYLSGDFVDYFKIDDKKNGFYIADVSGHGASSAFVTVLLKSAIEQILSRYQSAQDPMITFPDKVLSKLAFEIHSAGLGKYITMIYGMIDRENNLLSYSIGGHYPNPILLENGKAKFLEGEGFPVGILQKTAYKVYQIPFTEGSNLLLFSDGIAELIQEVDMNAKEKALLSIVAAGEGALEYLIARFDLNHKKDLPDDVTMLSITREK